MHRLLCVWLPNWPIQRHRTSQHDGKPESQDSPIVLWKENSRRGRQVVSCCARARAMGVRVAMPIAQAGELIRHLGSHPVMSRHEPSRDREALDQVAGQLQAHISPLVCIESLDRKPWADYPRHQCESLFCDIAGSTHLFGDEVGVVAEINRLLSQQGLVGRMAIAGSMGAAWALSHYLDCVPATTSGTLLKTQNAFIAPAEHSAAILDSLPIEALRISGETVRTLERLGVETIEQLLRLPRSGLASRLGTDLVKRIEQVLGERDEPLEVHRAPAEHRATLALEYPTSDQKILADRIERLVQKARAGLATRRRGALRLTCRLDLSAHPPLTLNVGLFAPSIDADHWSGLVINQLEAKLSSKRLSSCVERLTLSVTHTGSLRTSQQSLFETDSMVHSVGSRTSMSGSELSRLVDSLSSRLGRDLVLGVKLQDNPLPEKAFSVRPLTGNCISPRKNGFSAVQVASVSTRRSHELPSSVAAAGKASRSLPVSDRFRHPSPCDAMRRPLSLLSRPIPLAVAWEADSFFQCLPSQQFPNYLRLKGMVHRIVMHWGPERIETGWWEGPCTRRDYYRIETDSGRWWWIFRDLVAKSQATKVSCCRWMLHGCF